MPDFFPTPQLPTGLAELTAKLMAEQGGAWGDLAKNLGKDVGGFVHNLRNPTMLTPEQANALATGHVPSGNIPAPMPSIDTEQANALSRKNGGQPVDASPVFDPKVFPHGVPLSLVEQISKQREQEALVKMTTERMMGVQGIKREQAAEKDHTPATAEMLKNYPKIAKMGFEEGMLVPNKFISEQSAPLKASLGIRDEQFWQKQWVDTAKDMDISKASSRTPLGVATTNNMKAGRALKLLDSKKTFTPQDMSLITTDLTSMMKGGSPDEELLRQQQYGNLQTSGIALLQQILSKPENLNTPEVKQHLREIIKGIVEVDNGVIRGHIDSIESGRADIIAKRPKDWEKLKAKALSKIEDNKDSLDSLIDKHLGGQ